MSRDGRAGTEEGRPACSRADGGEVPVVRIVAKVAAQPPRRLRAPAPPQHRRQRPARMQGAVICPHAVSPEAWLSPPQSGSFLLYSSPDWASHSGWSHTAMLARVSQPCPAQLHKMSNIPGCSSCAALFCTQDVTRRGRGRGTLPGAHAQWQYDGNTSLEPSVINPHAECVAAGARTASPWRRCRPPRCRRRARRAPPCPRSAPPRC